MIEMIYKETKKVIQNQQIEYSTGDWDMTIMYTDC